MVVECKMSFDFQIKRMVFETDAVPTPPQVTKARGHPSSTYHIPHSIAHLPLPTSADPRLVSLLRMRFVIRMANRKSLAIGDSVTHLRKALCTDLLYKKLALRF